MILAPSQYDALPPACPQLYSTEIKKVPCLLHMPVLPRVLFCMSIALKDISFVVLF